MEKIKYLAFIFVVLSIASFSKDKRIKIKSKGELICEQDKINVGQIKSDTVLKHCFRFRNIGSEELKITQFDVSCNCTKANVSDSIVLPLETCDFFMEIDTKGKSKGKHYVVAIFQTNGQRRFYKLTSSFEIQ